MIENEREKEILRVPSFPSAGSFHKFWKLVWGSDKELEHNFECQGILEPSQLPLSVCTSRKLEPQPEPQIKAGHSSV